MHLYLGLLSAHSSACIVSGVVLQQPPLDLANHGEQAPVGGTTPRPQSIFVYFVVVSNPSDLQLTGVSPILYLTLHPQSSQPWAVGVEASPARSSCLDTLDFRGNTKVVPQLHEGPVN